MRKYWAIFAITLKDAYAYRTEGFIYFLADLVTPLLMMVVWAAVFKFSNSVGIYNKSQLLSYYFYIFIFRTLLSVYPHEISERIKSGEFSAYLLKPFNILTFHLFTETAWKINRLIYLFISVIIIKQVFLPGVSVFSFQSTNMLFFAIAILCGYLLNYFIKAVLETFAFWTTESEGIRLSYYAIEAFLSGSFIPLNLMPELIKNSSWFLPFKYFYAFPTEIALGTLSVKEIAAGTFFLIAWLIMAVLMSKLMLSKGIKQYSAVGG